MDVSLPYGDGNIDLYLQEIHGSVDLLLPRRFEEKIISDFRLIVEKALSSPLGLEDTFAKLDNNSKIAITINDKTRPVPNDKLIIPLIKKLRLAGVSSQNITFFIASGTHLPMERTELNLIVGSEISDHFRILAHNCDEKDNLYEIGLTNRKTPIFVNKEFYDHDLKIVVGDIELHHFAGFSGGVKSAAIGLCGRETINTNHRLLLDERSAIGEYEHNPLRQDIEEIGELIGIDLALNAVLTEKKEIIDVFFGDPVAVMRAGIKLVKKLTQIPVTEPYDTVIASPGGFPKDINLYQSQKAMTHAALFARENGLIILFAECREGVGSKGFIDYMTDKVDYKQVIEKFSSDTFTVGPHKAFQIAHILKNNQVYLYSSIDAALVKKLMLIPLTQPGKIVELIQRLPPSNKRIAVLPYATACIPNYQGGTHE